MTKWCYNTKTGEVFSYIMFSQFSNFPPGHYLAYGDYLVSGLESEEEANRCAEKYGCCDVCGGAKIADEEGRCKSCGNIIRFVRKGESKG